MAKKLRVELDFQTARANQKAREATRNIRGIRDEGKATGKDLTDGMEAGARATSGFTRQVLALGASYVGLTALQQYLQSIIGAYNKAIELRREFAQGAISGNRAVAGAAAQFGTSEQAMRQLVSRVGVAAGAGPSDVPGIVSLLTAASSAGIVSTISPDTAGNVTLGTQDFGTLARLEQFVQRTGAYGQETNLAKLVAKGLGGRQATQENLGGVLGRIRTAFRESQLSSWGEFITGAIAGTSAMLEEGVGFETAIGGYAGLAKMERSGVTAGETFRLIAMKFFTADDPKMIAEVDRRLGKGAYWRLKEEDPDTLYRTIEDILLSSEGPARAKLFRKLGVQPEQGARISKLRSARGEVSKIRRLMAGAPSMVPELEQWRAEEDRPTAQAGEMAAWAAETYAGEGQGQVESLRSIAESAQKRLRAAAPAQQWISEFLNWRKVELSNAIKSEVAAYFQEQGWETATLAGYDIDVTGAAPSVDRIPWWSPRARSEVYQTDEETFRGRVSQALRGIQSATAATPQVIIGVQYNNPPTQREQNTTTRTGQ